MSNGEGKHNRILKKTRHLAKFKDRYKGERCFLIGNGPSLRMEDLDKLHHNREYSFASNRVYVAFKKTKWRPTFYTVQDHAFLVEYHSDVDRLRVKYKFISDWALVRENDKRTFRSANIFHAENTPYYPYCPGFSTDITERVYVGATIIYSNIQVASYMGFSEMYLLGVDQNYVNFITEKEQANKLKSVYFFAEGNSNEHFANGYIERGAKLLLPNLDKSLLAFEKAEIYSRYNGFRIYNATRGGRLEVFERVEFDDLVIRK